MVNIGKKETQNLNISINASKTRLRSPFYNMSFFSTFGIGLLQFGCSEFSTSSDFMVSFCKSILSFFCVPLKLDEFQCCSCYCFFFNALASRVDNLLFSYSALFLFFASLFPLNYIRMKRCIFGVFNFDAFVWQRQYRIFCVHMCKRTTVHFRWTEQKRENKK